MAPAAGGGFVAPALRSIAATVWPAAAVLAVQVVAFPVPLGVVLQGVVLGLVLVYRANRVVNLAQAWPR